MRPRSVFALFLGSTLFLAAGCCSTPRPKDSHTFYPDGLSRSTPEAEGVPSKSIARFFEQVEEKGYDVHGLMILRHEKVVAEHWWAPYAPEYQHAMYSATKTFTAMAVGFAVQEDLLSPSDQVISFFPDLLPETISPELEKLTVEHLLTMSVGHASTRYAGSGKSQIRSFLSAPFAHEPGTSFAYNITASHTLSHIITRVSGVSIYEYLKPRLLDPLGIEDVVWEMDNDGINMGNGGSHMKTSDLAKLGLLLSNQGAWNGEQLLDPTWIDAATTPHIFQHPEWTPEQIANATDDGAQGYGYQIWMGRHNSYRAIGGQNQLVLVIPEYDLIVACHSSISDEAGFNSLIYDMLPSFSENALKPDSSLDLKAAIADYKIKRPFEGTSVSKVTMNTRRYEMAENDLGVESVLFRFDGAGDCTLTLVCEGAIHNILFGLDDWKIGMTDRTLSFARTVYPNPMGVTPVRTAGICTWTTEDQLSAYYLSMFNPGSTETFRFSFEGDQLKMEIVPPTGARLGPPGMEPPKKQPIILTGTGIKD